MNVALLNKEYSEDHKDQNRLNLKQFLLFKINLRIFLYWNLKANRENS